MLTIRLARVGRKKKPSYRLIISEKARDTFGRSLEILGHYHPLNKKGDGEKLILNKERIEYWLSKGAQTSNTVHNLLVDAKVIDGAKKRTIFTIKKKKKGEKVPPSEEGGIPTPPKATAGQDVKKEKEIKDKQTAKKDEKQSKEKEPEKISTPPAGEENAGTPTDKVEKKPEESKK